MVNLPTNEECRVIRREFARRERLERLPVLQANEKRWRKEYLKGRKAILSAKDKPTRKALSESLYSEGGAAWKWAKYAAELDVLETALGMKPKDKN